MLTDDPSAGKSLVLLFLLRGQFSTPRFLFRGLAITVQFLDALIASVCTTLYLVLYGYFAPLEQFEIVLASLADGDTDDLAALVRDDELGLLSMALFLPAVVWPLFFCGRSTGLSPTSTMITANSMLSSRNFFLPGK
jgi:hypothetical protein